MKNKFFIAMVLVVLGSLILSSLYVWAATDTIEVLGPNASTTNSGTLLLRAQVNGTNFTCITSGCTEALANITTVQWEYSSDAGSTWIPAASNRSNINNGTLANWTASFVSTSLSDAISYQWRAKAANSTANRSTSAVLTAVIFDNFVPATPSITSPVAGSNNGLGMAISASCANASSASLTLGARTYSMTMGGTQGAETCSYTFGGTEPAKRIYNDVSITSTDLGPANQTTSTAITLTVDERSGNKGAVIAASLASQGRTVQASQKGELSVVGSGDALSLGGIWSGSVTDWFFGGLAALAVLTLIFPALMAFFPPPFNLAGIVVGVVGVVVL